MANSFTRNSSISYETGDIYSEFIFTHVSFDEINRKKTVNIKIYGQASTNGLNPIRYYINGPNSENYLENDDWQRLDTFLSPSLTTTKTLILNKDYTFPVDKDGNSALEGITHRTKWDENTQTWVTSTGQIAFYIGLSANPSTSTYFYTVNYDANGGSGAPSSQVQGYDPNYPGENWINLSYITPVRSGYKFIEWNTKNDGTGTSYKPNGVYDKEQNITLYAIWQKNESTEIPSTPGTGGNSGAVFNVCEAPHFTTVKEGMNAIVETEGELIRVDLYRVLQNIDNSDLEGDISDASTEITSLKNNVNQLQSYVNELEAELKDNINELSDDITETNSNVNTATKNISSLTNTVNTATKNISSLTNSVNTANQNISSLTNSVTNATQYAKGSNVATNVQTSTEKAVGTWIDGKTIYKRAWQFKATSQNINFASGLNYANISLPIKMDLICKCDPGITPLYCDGGGTEDDFFRAFLSSTDSKWYVQAGTANPPRPYDGIIIFEYTKK